MTDVGLKYQDEELLAHSRALGDPTRLGVFCHIRDSIGPVDVAELTELFGLNHNAIRQHLAKLRDVGLIVEERAAPGGPGRPKLIYRAMPGAAERIDRSGPHEALSMMLLSLIRGDGSPAEVGRKAGRNLAAEYRSSGSGSADGTVAVIEAVARRMGFEPFVESVDGAQDVVLARCPFVGPAGASPEIVCAIHRGLAEGIAEHAADGSTIVDLRVNPPREANCRVVVATPGEDNHADHEAE